MLIGYARVSKADGSQSLDLQRDALVSEGVDPGGIYEDRASGAKEGRPGLEACLRVLREGDVLVLWKLDRLGRNLAHLVGTVQALSDRGVGLRALAGQGAQIDTTTAGGRLVFGIFAALAQGVISHAPASRVRGRTHPRAYGGGIEGGAGARAQGRSQVCALEGAGAARGGGDGEAGHVGGGVVPGVGDRARNPLPLRGAGWRAAGAWKARVEGVRRLATEACSGSLGATMDPRHRWVTENSSFEG